MSGKLLKRFNVYDLTVIAVMAALGIAIKPIVAPLAHVVSGPLMMPSGSFVGGLYMMWIVIGYGIIKKKGTATLISLVQAIIVMISGIVGSHGIMSLFTYLAPGIAVDLFFILSRHSGCCRGCCVIAGLIANVTGTACVNIVFFRVPGIYLIFILAVAAVSGAVGGWIAWELLKALEKYRVIKPRKGSFTEETSKKPPALSVKKGAAILLIIVIALGAGAGIYYYSSNNRTSASGYSVSIKQGDNVIAKVSLKKISEMKAQTVKTTIVSSSEKDEKGSFTGVPVSAFLENADKGILGRYKTFIFTSGDGYSAAFSAKEIKQKSDLMLIYKKNGKYLEHYNEGGSGPVRLLALKDKFGNRSVKYLVRITCRK